MNALTIHVKAYKTIHRLPEARKASVFRKHSQGIGRQRDHPALGEKRKRKQNQPFASPVNQREQTQQHLRDFEIP